MNEEAMRRDLNADLRFPTHPDAKAHIVCEAKLFGTKLLQMSQQSELESRSLFSGACSVRCGGAHRHPWPVHFE